MSIELRPDDALQGWRDQIEENARLQHAIADRDEQIEELARLNNQALFEANRYKALYDAAIAERDYLVRVRETMRAKLEAFGSVALDVAHSIENMSTLAILAINAEPAPMPPQPPADPTPPPTPAEPSPPITPDPLTDPALELPAFLTNNTGHVTPLPAVVP